MNLNRRRFFKTLSLTTANLAIFSASGYSENIANFIAKKPDKNRKTSEQPLSVLSQKFITPSPDTGSSCYWWWFNGLVSKEGITRDLEEFHKKGLGGVLLVNSASGLGGAAMPKGVKLFSKEWCELYRHALQEAARLKIEVGVNFTSGWCMGGPWIKPENSGRWFLQSKIKLKGPQNFSGKLPLPGNRDGYDNVFNPPGFKEYIDLPLERLDYRDSAVVAIPEIEGAVIQDKERKSYFSAKTNRKDASNFTKAKDIQESAIHPWQNLPGDNPVPVRQVIDLTSKLRKDGSLEWNVPPGNWIVIRTGHRMTGSRPMIAQPEADGLSVDWLASEPIDIQFKNFGKLLLEIAATVKGNTLRYFCDDSFEDGFPNWTEKILEKFQYYRGYDPKPYLPVLAGYIIGSAEISDRFLHDYRKTVADCMADGHYKRFADLCHENGLLVQNESAGPSRSGTMCMDGLKNLGRSDYPQGEFWLGLRYDEEGGEDHNLSYGVSRLENGQNKVTKMTASASHIYGKQTASAEAFTQFRHWHDSPGSLKPALDRAFCEGINRIVIHSTTSTRPEDGLPGYEYGAGTHFNPNVTWWDKSGPFLSYIARSQYLLRQGKFVADVLYYNGDWAPNIVEPKHTDPYLGSGYDYDVCNEEVLLTRISVKKKRLVLPDGMSYHMLVLPDTSRMPLPVLKKIRELVKAGATVVGPRPEKDPGLKNFPENDQELKVISSEVWGSCNGKEVTMHNYGKGRIFDGIFPKEILRNDQLPPDFEYSGDSETFIDYIHRSLDHDIEIYFIVNRKNRTEKTECTFRISGSRPEIWDPVSGEILKDVEFTDREGRTTLLVEFFPHQSFFVIFKKNEKQIQGTNQKQNLLQTKLLQEISGSWMVRFDPKWGGPAEIEFAKLEDWSKSTKDEIRFYSGKAVYYKKFDLSKSVAEGSRLFLDLGVVKNIAQVKLNGVDLGIIWTDPWRVEISSVVQKLNNILEIEIVNLWPNRLIGDASLPKDLRLTRTNIVFKSDAPLLPSGLLGPVTLHETFNV